MKRTPLNRRTPLVARTPLSPGDRPLGRHAPFTATVGLTRSTPLRFRSAKTAARYVSRREIVAEMFLYPEVCEVPWCTNTATDPHEPLTRARGGDILDRNNIRKVCHYHNWLFGQSEEPWMYELGFLVHSWAPNARGENHQQNSGALEGDAA